MPQKIKHINYALVAKPHTPMYVMHKYWARKPHNVVRKYIEDYSKLGDIVLDPFCGSGPTPIEAIKSGRKGIGIDLDPMAIFITQMSAIPININDVKSAFKKLKNNCEKKINDLYKTKCEKCGNDASIICTHWDNSTQTKIYYYCHTCKKKFNKTPKTSDLKLIKRIEKMKIPYWYPKNKLYYDGNAFLKKEKNESIADLFTKRNLICLTILLENINKIKDKKIKEIFRFTFTSLTHLASKLTPVRPTRPMSSFWAMHSYWVPPIFMESNVWHLFESAVYGPQGIIKGKTDSNKQIKYYKEAKRFSDLNNKANIFLKSYNALELRDSIPKNSVDYVFTDPPYGGSVQYFELSTLWTSWLNLGLEYQDEITINRQQNKDFDYYHQMLTAAFKQVYDVLKRGKYMTVTFHSTDIKVWTSIIKAVVLAGFDLEKIIYQPPARASAKGLLQPYGSAVGDYYIRFRKPESEKLKTAEEISEERYKRIVVEVAKRILAERGEPTIYQHILNGIIVELKKEGALLSGKENPDDIMKEEIGKEFVLVDIKDEKGKKIGQKWWFKNPSTIPYLEKIPLTDRVETAVVDVLRGGIKVSFDDVLQKIFIKFPNALTPETQSIKDILNEYATKTKDGKWRLRPVVRARESEHSKMIYYLSLLGKKLGYQIYIGKKEQSDIYNDQKLGDLCDDKDPVLRFIPTENKDRVKQIDVFWHDDGRIRYEFEVENTTAITEAIVRGSNIPHDTIKRFIIIPEERERLLHKKIQEPLLRQSMEKDKWNFIFYNDLEIFFNKTKRKKGIDIKEFEKITREPKLRKQKQENLNNFKK